MRPRASVDAALNEASGRLAAAGIAEPRREARLLLGDALGVGPESLIAHPDRVLADDEIAALNDTIERRSRREPMAYILGRREFWSLLFRVSSQTLDPRPDSETLIEAALDRVSDRSARLEILDLGTGGGCLLLALLSELPNARGLGIDASAGAAEIARANATALGFDSRARIEVGDWGKEVTGQFDLILSNPPYIPAGEIDRLAPEVALFEPRLALDGGEDGLAAFRALAPDIARLMARNGRGVIEIGAGQAGPACDIAACANLEIEEIRKDLAGLPRCLVLRHGS